MISVLNIVKPSSSENSLPMFTVLGYVLAIIGSMGAWVNLPLAGTSPDQVAELASYAEITDIFRRFFLITILLAAVSSVLQYRRVSLQIIFFSLLIIFGFVIFGLFQDHRLLQAYMSQSEERLVLQNFISEHYWPNINPEYTISFITEFEYLWQRLLINWNIIGIGCKTAFFGGLILLFGAALNARLQKRVYVIAGVILLAGLAIVLTPVLRAEVLHHQGDMLLDSGRQRQALEAYRAALRLDPMLEYSAPFAIKVSRLYHRLEGEDSVFAGLYLLHVAASGIGTRRLTPVFVEDLTVIQRSLGNIVSLEINGTRLQNTVIKQSKKEYIRSWVSRGLYEYEKGRPMASLRSLQAALQADVSSVSVKFFIAHVLLELKRQNDSLALLESALPSLWSKQLRADFMCTIGDVYHRMGKPLPAREAYTACYELDTVYNYRAVKHLSGT